jgi:ABC-2 type transport system ATP-binding protein
VRTRPALGLVAAVALALLLAPTPARADIRIEDPIVIRSFDGTPIVATLMLPDGAGPDRPTPAILQTHGWGGTRSTAPSGTVARLLDRGYAILTWDSRGFGDSGGEAGPGGPAEVADARALIDYLAGRPEIALDAPGDPRVGWIGVSNAGGVQLNTAAVDHRIDAIAPEISWGNLVQNLLPNGVPKTAWDELLYVAGAATASTGGLDSPAGTQAGVYSREIHEAHAQILATGELSEHVRAWFAERSTTLHSGSITTPTLLVQGTIDTLFPLEDAFANYANLVAAGTPVKLVTYCSGHTIAGCQYATGTADDAVTGAPVWEDRIVAWMDRWVRDDPTAVTGPAVEWQAQDGRYHGADHFPLAGTTRTPGVPLTTGPLAGPGVTGGDGPASGGPAVAQELGVTAARAVVLPPAATARSILGVPAVRLTGTALGLTAQVHMELVDLAPDGSRVTVDDQVMPFRFAGRVDQEVSLHGVAWRLEPGHALELELTTGSTQYAPPRTGPFTVELVARPFLPVAPA